MYRYNIVTLLNIYVMVHDSKVVVGVENATILDAVADTDFNDFEDALQDCCAIDSDADYIVTVNMKDFVGHSKTKAVTPDELLRIVAETEE